MEKDLKNRYIYAVTRHLPVKMKADVEQELDSLISEMADERKGNNNSPGRMGEQHPPGATSPSEQDIKDVLAELGTPEELALKYGGGEHKALISGIYFLMYKRVLSIVLPIVAAVLAVLTIVGFFVGNDSGTHVVIFFADISLIAQIITASVGGVVQVFAIITIIFAVLDYMKVDLKEIDLVSSDAFSDLPEIPEAKQMISPWGPLFGIALSISTTVLFLGFPQVMGLYFNNQWTPVFNISVIQGLWFPILIWTLLEVSTEIVKLAEGQYTMKLAAVSLITGILSVVCAVAIFSSNSIVNPEFITQATEMGGNLLGIEALTGVFENTILRPHMMIMTVVLIVIAVETIEIIVKAFQAKRD